jgi:hypothetical protein
MASPLLTSLADAQGLLHALSELVSDISRAIEDPSLTREEHYLERVAPQLNDATAKYQALASFLQGNKRDHDKEYRAIQRAFVAAMQELQHVQRQAAKRRELLCDADFVAVSKISAMDVQVAKEEMLEAQQIASEAVVVKQLFQEVGAIVHQQGQGIDQIESKVEAIRIEIGHGVNELQHARQLQREARQKYFLALALALLVAAAVIVPVVLAFT